MLKTNEKVVPDSEVIVNPADISDHSDDHNGHRGESMQSSPINDESPPSNSFQDETIADSSTNIQYSDKPVNQPSSPIRTRSGRTIRKPARYEC